ncbi:MAG TPA: hypothetical protein VFI25_08275 [Planctomycetota bacterium]|jgi:hypothetical protein|nr:hypothetical protein [Planctomycetota bacterium]
MVRRTRARLAAAAREYIAAEPWEYLAPPDLFGIRDRSTGRIACASVTLSDEGSKGMLLALGVGGFRLMDLRREGRSGPDDFLSDADLLSAVATKRGVEEEPGERPVSLGAFRGLRLEAWRKPRWRGLRGPSDADQRFLARALRAVARWASPAAMRAFVAPYPAFPMLTVSGRGEDLVVGETLESVAFRRTPVRPPASLPPGLRTAVHSRRSKGALVLRLVRIPMPAGGWTPRLLVFFIPGKEIILEARIFPPGRAVTMAWRSVCRALAARPMLRPEAILTDSYVFFEHTRDALAQLGIEVIYGDDMPPAEPIVLKALKDIVRRGGRRARRGPSS